MDAPYLTTNVQRDGPVCVLALHGEIDIVTVPAFTARVSQLDWEHTERLVLDLSGLSFSDCAGARALAAAVCAVPSECPVLVRSLRPAVRRVFELTGLDLENLRLVADPHPEWRTARLIADTAAARSWSRESVAGLRRAASMIASTEEQIAITFRELAAQRPRDADRLLAISDRARNEATRCRQMAAG